MLLKSPQNKQTTIHFFLCSFRKIIYSVNAKTISFCQVTNDLNNVNAKDDHQDINTKRRKKLSVIFQFKSVLVDFECLKFLVSKCQKVILYVLRFLFLFRCVIFRGDTKSAKNKLEFFFLISFELLKWSVWSHFEF